MTDFDDELDFADDEEAVDFSEFAIYPKADAPVYDLDQEWYEQPADALPGVWITRCVEDEHGNVVGRMCVGLYLPQDDEDGWEALSFGSNYYMEGMGYNDPADLPTRIKCFQATELLYRHAERQGNPIASLSLGYVYSYDRCEGKYFVDHRFTEDVEDYRRPYPREERAFACFSKAAEVGLAEGHYKLGDMYANGIGCEPDVAAAYTCYERAFELSKHESDAAVWGSAALRMADAAENGLGRSQSFEDALKFYEIARSGLEAAVRGGDWFYVRQSQRAEKGVRRMKQELQG